MDNPIKLIEEHQRRVDEMNELEIPENGTSLDLLQAIYRSSSLPLPMRLRAAGLAIQHEHPRLMATAQINEGSFAELLERRLKRVAEAKLIEANPQPVDVKPPMPRVGFDKRFRRI
jgi:hypothetical protein